MLPEPNFPVRPNEFVGRRREIDTFREALRQGLVKGRTSSFAVLGEWGIGKSSLLLKFADLCSDATFAMLPVFLSASNDIHDYLRFAESLLDKFAEALLARPNLQARLRTELQNWRFKRVHFGAVAFEHESPHRFLSSGSSLLRHMLKEAWDHFLRPARLNGAIFFVDDLQNITSISKADLALIIRDQFQWFGIEMLKLLHLLFGQVRLFRGNKSTRGTSSAVLYEALSRAFHVPRDSRIRTLSVRPTARHLRESRRMAPRKDPWPLVLSCLYL